MKRVFLALVALVVGLYGAAALAADPLPSAVVKALGAPSRKAEVALLEEAVQTTTDPTLLPWILLYAGEARRLNDEPGLARSHFERVAGDFPSHRARNPAILGMAVVDAGRAPNGNTRATLELIGEENVPDTMNADRFLLLARAQAREGAPADAVGALLEKAQGYAHGDKEVSKRIGREVAALQAGAAGSDSAPALPSGPGDQIAIEEIRAALAAGRMPDVQRMSEAFATRYADSPHAREAAYALRRATSGRAPVAGRVAVLLPLTGEYAQPAASLKSAIELANQRITPRAELKFYDTGDKAEGCSAVLEKAVLTDGAVLAIGPLQREMALACAPTAQALRVPLLTLTSSLEPLAAGDQVFHTFPATENQIAALLTEARDTRNMTRFAILHPTTSYGENAAAAFTAMAQARGATVVRSKSYAPDTKDFRNVAQGIVPAGGAPDFDALFIPDAYPRVALLASALAYQEIPVGAFRPDRDDVPIILLGLNAWHNDELAARGGKYVQDCLFVDAFDPRAADPAIAAFVDAWEAQGAGPPTVVEAVGYDTMLLAGAALAKGGPDLAAALAAAQPTGSVTGVVGFDETRDARRVWRMFTVTRDGVVPLAAPSAP